MSCGFENIFGGKNIMENEVYYNKKKSPLKLILCILSAILFIGLVYFLNFFNINPNGVLTLINNGEMSPAYTREYIFTITPDVLTENMPELQMVFSEDNNTVMSESMQDISLSIGEDEFYWQRFFKFDTAFIKTPYDSRYIRFDKFADKYSHTYFKNKSNLLDVLTTVIGDNANILFDSNKYDNKKMKILGYGETFNDKVKLNYSIKLTPEQAAEAFGMIYDGAWNSPEFASFFKSDDDIQKELEIVNNTKSLLDMLDNLKNSIIIESAKVEVVANKDFSESVNFEFTVKTKDGKSSMKISVGEYLRVHKDDMSPEATFEPLSVIKFEDLVPYSKQDPIIMTPGNEVENATKVDPDEEKVEVEKEEQNTETVEPTQ